MFRERDIEVGGSENLKKLSGFFSFDGRIKQRDTGTEIFRICALEILAK